ncbi:hypothetical protein IWQ60_004553 [Tieghemiomyces parasiticus]|uniref:RlpA-like protein double-psi beta-barrel domain-containing protein n=1 Tax=Tieghemiomyces parasiticus TaxID=78921 RepID=A0A9W8DVE5_9FUNG|nr:hypothetical protein IWQ60_004553 [Tieghemiomyces parasiticus]
MNVWRLTTFALSALLGGVVLAQNTMPVLTGPAYYQSNSDMTGSCNIRLLAGSHWVGLGNDIMQNPPNPNNNPLCGKLVTVTHNGVSLNCTVGDTCDGCSGGMMTISYAALQYLDPDFNKKDFSTVSWSFVP